MDVFGEDAEPFDLDDDSDLDLDDQPDEDDDDLEDASEDDVDVVLAAYREEGKVVVQPMDFDLANDLDELIDQLRRLPGDSGADGFVSVGGDCFVICRVRGRNVEVLLSDAEAAHDWPIARDVVDFLGEEGDEDEGPVGDLGMYAANGLRDFELEAIASDYDIDSVEQLLQIARRLGIGEQFEQAVEAFDA